MKLTALSPSLFQWLRYGVLCLLFCGALNIIGVAPNGPGGLFLHHATDLSAAKISLSGGRIEPIRIVLAMDHQGGAAGAEWQQVIADDLQSSHYFLVQKALTSDIQNFAQNPKEKLRNWKSFGAQKLVIIREVKKQGDLLDRDTKSIRLVVYELNKGKKTFDQMVTLRLNHLRYDAHQIANQVFTHFIGESSNFASKTAYVATGKSAKDTKKRLVVMDIDGKNAKFLSSGKINVSRPILSADGRFCSYLAMRQYAWKIYIFDFSTHQHRQLDIPGNSFAQSFSPDGNEIIFSHYQNGSSNIAIYNLKTNQYRYVTNHSAIDTSPAFAPDGKKIVFESMRSGSQQLYIKDLESGAITRLSTGAGQYAAPSWSVRGDYIAFTRIYQGEFYIGVMRPDGSGEKILSKSFMVENPAFAPNGREILYYRQTRQNKRGDYRSRLYAVDLLTGKTRLVRTVSNAEDPSWSIMEKR